MKFHLSIIIILFYLVVSGQETLQLKKLIYIGGGHASFERSVVGKILEFGYEYKFDTSFAINFNYIYAAGEESIDPNIFTYQNQFNTNFLYSPFDNNRKLDFRMGIGGSLAHINDKFYEGNNYKNLKKFRFGYNIQFSILTKIYKNIKIGSKFEIQNYSENLDVNNTLSLIIGYSL